MTTPVTQPATTRPDDRGSRTARTFVMELGHRGGAWLVLRVHTRSERDGAVGAGPRGAP